MLIEAHGKSKPCGWCSTDYCEVYHTGACPKVKSIEYFENGSVKKVEFHQEYKYKDTETTK